MYIRCVCLMSAFSMLATSCIGDDYELCPGSGTSAPVPSPRPNPSPGPIDPGDFGAEGDRYRKTSDGTVCRCGIYEIGCHETPEGAQTTMSCSFRPDGAQECEAYTLPPPPPTAWDNEAGEESSRKRWTCTMGKYDRKPPGKLLEEFARTERADTKTVADDQARSWADDKNARDNVYWWALIGFGCQPTEGEG